MSCHSTVTLFDEETPLLLTPKELILVSSAVVSQTTTYLPVVFVESLKSNH